MSPHHPISWKWWEDRVPELECENCGDCCGPAPLTEREATDIFDYAFRHKIKPMPAADGITWPWRQDERCAVWPVRPFICRLQGRVPRVLECGRGHPEWFLKEGKCSKLEQRYLDKIGHPDMTTNDMVREPEPVEEGPACQQPEESPGDSQ